MRIVRAKVLATGEEKVLVEGSKPDVFTEGLDDNVKEYKADELEILGDSTTMGWPAFGVLASLFYWLSAFGNGITSTKAG